MSTWGSSSNQHFFLDMLIPIRWDALKLGKDGALQVGVLRKPLVEGHHLAIGRQSKGRQERVVPDFGRKGLALCKAPPERLEASRFPYKTHAGIVTASTLTAFGFVASRRKPCCVNRQNAHPSLDTPSNQFLAAT
jgi:hypothetical protein